MKTFLKWFRKEETIPADAGPIYHEVRKAIADVQAYARSHGGEIQLVGVSEEGDVQIKLNGACNGCPLSDITLKQGIETQLKQIVPGVRKVTQVV